MRRGLRAGAGALASVVLGAGLLAGCSGTPQEEYCDEVDDRSEALSEVTEPADLPDALPELEGLAEAAPRDIADSWGVVVRRVTDLAQALEDAGVDPATYDPEDPPEGVSEEQREAIVAAAQGLVDRETLAAIGDVEQHALDVCGARLGL